MSRLATRAELIKLARDFQREPEALDSLSVLGVERLARLRNLCADQQFKRYQGFYQKLAAASGLLPAKLAVMLGEKVFGAYLGGRIGSQLDTERALKFADLASSEYLAEICETIDPRRVLTIVQGIAPSRISKICSILVARRDFISMGKFVDAITEEQLQVVLQSLDDPEVMLQAGFYTEGKQRLEEIIHLVDENMLRQVIQVSVESGHFSEALSLITHLGPEGESRLADIAADLGNPVLSELVRVAHAEKVWKEILPLVLRMSEDNRVKVMQVPGLLEPGVLEELLRAGHEQGLWEVALPMLAHTTPEFQQELLKVKFLYEPETVRALLDAVNRTNSHTMLLRLLLKMSVEDQRKIYTASQALDAGLLQEIMRTASQVKGAADTWLYREIEAHL